LAVVQQSVHLITNEAQRARVGARCAWAMVAILGTAIVVAVGWTTSLVTRGSMTADALRDRLIESRDSQQKAAEKLDRLETELAKADQARAQADGQLEEVRRQVIQAEQRAADEARRAQAIEAASHVPASPTGPTTAPATRPGEHASVNGASAGVELGH
jgi:chromosome segregation ATPase